MLNLRRHTLLALVAAPGLAATLTAAAPASAARADIMFYRQTFYSDASHSTVVGYGTGFCDGDYIMSSGYQTPYSTFRFLNPCP